MAKKKKRTVRRGSSRKRSSKNSVVLSILSFLFKVIPIIVVLAVIALVVKLSIMLLFESSYFEVKDIKVTVDGINRPSDDVVKLMRSKKGLNIFKADIKRAEYEVKTAHPEFKNVIVARLLPDTLEISYLKRIPVCQIDSGYYYLVSDDAVILPETLVVAESNLPVITGIKVSRKDLSLSRGSDIEGLKRAIELIDQAKKSGFTKNYKQISKINVYDLKNPAIFLDDRTRIEIGEYNFEEKQGILREIIDELESKGKKARVIDLRFEDVVVIPR